jgi:hypothetical protein
MEFMALSAYRKLSNANASKALMDINKKNAHQFMLLRTKSPYFTVDKDLDIIEFIEPSCPKDARFNNKEQQSIYHKICSAKQFVPNKVIDWSPFNDPSLHQVKPLIQAAQLVSMQLKARL